MKSTAVRIFLLCLPLYFTACSEDGDFNVFSTQQDLELGQQTDQQIRSEPQEFPILDPQDYPQAYAYLQGMVDEIVSQGNVPYADLFPYEVAIINKDVENAFATPGGFLYVYTGLVQRLETGDQLAGVMAHEIAHSAERHSTDQLTKQYGISTLLSLISGGDPGLLSQIASGLLTLQFSRSDESEADDRSVDYLCETDYAANGAAGFFEMIQDSINPPAFLSTHPNPDDRVQEINQRAIDKNCDTNTAELAPFQQFQRNLPK
ncbi:putative Zn-dependent protease [Lewinella aquimaris]|uniref:Putative Zn-dependent protease n=1 Tax=Neolewinella aquimaris TaxID=1835722 RepID=A0A840EFL1_9BACT|nr:M48 family metallopeptidase [Neolewinella aquimaris]MBB4079716.1 putative Zn-dependent protease [Neolewinella aquimaris]